MIEKICSKCGSKYQSNIKSFFKYCSTLCRSKDKFIQIEDKNGDSFNVWKENFLKYPDFYSNLYKTDRLMNKCFICGNEYKSFRMCCSNECSGIMKKQTTFKTTGAEHNLSRESKSRSNMEENLIKLHGVRNVYQRFDVKERLKNTWNLKYGYDNPSKSEAIKIKKRKEAEKNGFWIPRGEWDERKVYETNVNAITWSQMKKFAELKFGDNIWNRIRESRKLSQTEWLTVDHKYSKVQGFLEKLDPSIIGHICNLDIMTFSENRNKWSSCSITIDELKIEIEKFNKNIRDED
jgi:hypothetical protein